eukprot:3006218-Alexandrium_andersonii.AAC.1
MCIRDRLPAVLAGGGLQEADRRGLRGDRCERVAPAAVHSLAARAADRPRCDGRLQDQGRPDLPAGLLPEAGGGAPRRLGGSATSLRGGAREGAPAFGRRRSGGPPPAGAR